MAYELLFTPLRVRDVELPNRIQFLSIATALGPRLGPAAEAFVAARAAGGAGSICSQPFLVDPQELPPGGLAPWDRDSIGELASYAAAVHRHGSVLFGQLQHAGRQHHSVYPALRFAPSAVPCEWSGWVPHAMTAEEIGELIERYVASAANLAEAGFDGVDLNASHGHLLQQFLSPLSNVRDDEYGGDFDRRLRVVHDIIEGIRAACGDGFVIQIRHCADELLDGIGIDRALGLALAVALDQRTSVDILAVSQSNFMSKPDHVPDLQVPPMPYVDRAADIRAAVSRALVVATGRIRTAEEAEQLLADGTADVIGMGRPLVSDPELPNKARAGAPAAATRRCIYCNMCWGNINQGRPIGCVQNPLAGKELSLGPVVPVANDEQRRVVVVGGGPGGMAAAEAAAVRGHQVTLLERSPALGGQLALAAATEGHEEYAAVTEHLAYRLSELGVDVRLGVEATSAEVGALGPDAVVVATGSAPVIPPDVAASGLPVLTAWEVLTPDGGAATFPLAAGQRVLLLDDDGFASAMVAAEHLAQMGIGVDYATRWFHAGKGLPEASVTRWIGRLHAAGVRFWPTSWFDHAVGQLVFLRHELSKVVEPVGEVDALVVGGGNRVIDRLYQELLSADDGVEVTVVGDALAPRSMRWAIDEGHLAGRRL